MIATFTPCIPTELQKIIQDLFYSGKGFISMERLICEGSFDLHLSQTQLAKKCGYTHKSLWISTEGTRFLLKKMSYAESNKLLFITILANLIGLHTPIGVPVRCVQTGPGNEWFSHDGVLLPFIEDCQSAKNFSWAESSRRNQEYALLSRWFNQLIGNQDVWWGQFLLMSSGSRAETRLINIDFDDAFKCVSPSWFSHVLKEHFAITVSVENTKWRSEPFDFVRPMGFSPQFYDSRYTLFGRYFYTYFQSKIATRIRGMISILQAAEKVPKETIRRLCDPYVRSHWMESQGYIQMPGSDLMYSPNQWVSAFCERYQSSFEEFKSFLDELEFQKDSGQGEIYDHFTAMTGNDY